MVHAPSAIPKTPSARQPVVLGGTKYRIWLVTEGGIAEMRTALGGQYASVPIADLGWDEFAGVWRPMAAHA